MFYILLCSFCFYFAVNGIPMVVKEDNKVSDKVLLNVTKTAVIDDHKIYIDKVSENISRIRVKRQSSSASSKFTEASKMPQIKQLRLFLQMFKNLWDSSYVGGAHPFHHNIPKVIVKLYKEKLVEFFLPDVGVVKDSM